MVAKVVAKVVAMASLPLEAVAYVTASAGLSREACVMATASISRVLCGGDGKSTTMGKIQEGT